MPHDRAFLAGLLVLDDGSGQVDLLCPFFPHFEQDCDFLFSPADGILNFFGLPESFFFFHGNTIRFRIASGMSQDSVSGTGFTDIP
jgi:hypothetical protein